VDLAGVQAALERAVEETPIPGCAAAVGSVGGREEVLCVGAVEPGGEAVAPHTWYDLASLTKVLCTTSLLLEQIEAGRLDPQRPLRELLPEVAWPQPAPSLGNTTVAALASHTSGLPAWEPLYLYGPDRRTLLERVLQTPLGSTRGSVVYSDLGYIVLGHLLERHAGSPLATLGERLFVRLDLADGLGFRPAGSVAPTEHCPWRDRRLRGEVHDENAAALGGAAGHAGLFGTVLGVAGFLRALLEGRIHSALALEYLAREVGRSPDGERRGFGWVLAFEGWSGGDFASPRAIGHTGFTGTGAWLDLERGTYTVLLTNRVYAGRQVETGIRWLRRAFNHAAAATFRT
jgi:CubicO group peptidase (beta-lactamase class C family)